jgi:hypothetical protein
MSTIYFLNVLSCCIVRSLTISSSFLECMYIRVLCFTLVSSKLECISVVWNSIRSTNDNKLEPIEQKFAAELFSFLPGDELHVKVTCHVLRLRVEQMLSDMENLRVCCMSM